MLLLDDEVLLLFRIRHSHRRLLFHLCTFCLGGEDCIDELWLALQALQRILGGQLLGFFLGKACSLFALNSFQQHLETEDRAAILVFLLLQHPIFQTHTVLL